MLKNKKHFLITSHCNLELLRKSHYLLTDPRMILLALKPFSLQQKLQYCSSISKSLSLMVFRAVCSLVCILLFVSIKILLELLCVLVKIIRLQANFYAKHLYTSCS